MTSLNTNIDELDKILQLAGNLAIKTANKYLEDDFKLGLIERLKLPEETDFTSAKTQLEALLSAAKIQAYDKAIEDAITRTMGINDVAVARERIRRLLTKEKQ